MCIYTYTYIYIYIYICTYIYIYIYRGGRQRAPAVYVRAWHVLLGAGRRVLSASVVCPVCPEGSFCAGNNRKVCAPRSLQAVPAELLLPGRLDGAAAQCVRVP